MSVNTMPAKTTIGQSYDSGKLDDAAAAAIDAIAYPVRTKMTPLKKCRFFIFIREPPRINISLLRTPIDTPDRRLYSAAADEKQSSCGFGLSTSTSYPRSVGSPISAFQLSSLIICYDQ